MMRHSSRKQVQVLYILHQYYHISIIGDHLIVSKCGSSHSRYHSNVDSFNILIF